jgi:hypothetical protein
MRLREYDKVIFNSEINRFQKRRKISKNIVKLEDILIY